MGGIKQRLIGEMPDSYELYPDEVDDAATSLSRMREADAGITLPRLPATHPSLPEAEPLGPQARLHQG